VAARGYKLFVGESYTDRFLLELSPPIRTKLEEECRAEWREHHKLCTPVQAFGTYEPLDQWLKSFEGKFQNELLTQWFLGEAYAISKHGYVDLDVKRWNAASAALQTQGRGPRGKRKQFDDMMWSFAAYKKYRNWKINKLLAETMGVEFDEDPPLTGINAVHVNMDNYILAAERFEQWTGLDLPPQAWVYVKERQRQADAAKVKQKRAA